MLPLTHDGEEIQWTVFTFGTQTSVSDPRPFSEFREAIKDHLKPGRIALRIQHQNRHYMLVQQVDESVLYSFSEDNREARTLKWEDVSEEERASLYAFCDRAAAVTWCLRCSKSIANGLQTEQFTGSACEKAANQSVCGRCASLGKKCLDVCHLCSTFGATANDVQIPVQSQAAFNSLHAKFCNLPNGFANGVDHQALKHAQNRFTKRVEFVKRCEKSTHQITIMILAALENIQATLKGIESSIQHSVRITS